MDAEAALGEIPDEFLDPIQVHFAPIIISFYFWGVGKAVRNETINANGLMSECCHLEGSITWGCLLYTVITVFFCV